MYKELIIKLTQEDNELLDKIEKLDKYICSQEFDLLPFVRQNLLKIQKDIMMSYHDILVARIVELRG